MPMGSVPIPIDISSDEDGLTDWIYELLNAKKEEEEEGSRRKDDSDDDCVILESDPAKPVEVKDDNGGGGGGGGDGSDDLVVVGDKGEIACRDFPHSRHVCAIYPFCTTSHEKHCSLCHCYVCDSLAPCIYWGNGFSFMDHCHATDKDEMWKSQRKSFKATNTVTLPRERPSDATIQMISPPIRNSAPIRPVSVPHPTQPSILNSLRPCSASSVATPYAPGQRHHQWPPVISSRGQNLSQQSSRSLSSTPGTQCVQKGRPGAEALAHSVMKSSHSKFKRAGTPGSGLISSSITRPQYKPPDVIQHRPMPQKSDYPWPVQVLRSQPQAVTSHSTHTTLVNPRLTQQTTVTSQRSQLSTMSHRTPQRSHPSSTPQRMPATSQRSQLSSTSQRTPVTSQGSQLSSTRQIPPSMPVPSQTPQCTPVVQSDDSVKKLEDSFKELQDILGSDVSGSVLTGIQPPQASSQCPSVGSQIPSQEMGFHHPGPLPTSPDPVDFDCSWLDRRAGENFTEVGEPAVQLSEPLVSLWNTEPEASSIDSILSSVQQEVVPVVGKEVGLPDNPTMPLYDFGGATW